MSEHRHATYAGRLEQRTYRPMTVVGLSRPRRSCAARTEYTSSAGSNPAPDRVASKRSASEGAGS